MIQEENASKTERFKQKVVRGGVSYERTEYVNVPREGGYKNMGIPYNLRKTELYCTIK